MSSLSSKTGCVFGAERVYIAKEVVLSDYYYSTTYSVLCNVGERRRNRGTSCSVAVVLRRRMSVQSISIDSWIKISGAHIKPNNYKSIAAFPIPSKIVQADSKPSTICFTSIPALLCLVRYKHDVCPLHPAMPSIIPILPSVKSPTTHHD